MALYEYVIWSTLNSYYQLENREGYYIYDF